MGASHRHACLSGRALVQTLLHAMRGTSVRSSSSSRQGTLRSLALTAGSRRGVSCNGHQFKRVKGRSEATLGAVELGTKQLKEGFA